MSATGGKTSLILLHGFAQSGRSWDRLVEIAAERGFLAQDGSGWETCIHEFFDPAVKPSRARREYFSWDAVCEDLLATFFESEKPPVVVGYSMGGRLALGALYRWWKNTSKKEERALLEGPSWPIGALVLEGAGLGPADEEERKALAQRNQAWADRLRREGVRSFIDYWENLPLFGTQRLLSDKVRAFVREDRLNQNGELLALALEGWGAHRMPSRHELAEMLRCMRAEGVPVFYIAGEEDSKYASLARSLEAEGAVQALIVDGVGHNVHLENPSKYADVLTKEICQK